jgi:hypothetical protein
VQVQEEERKTRGVCLGVGKKIKRKRTKGVCLQVDWKVKRRIGKRPPNVHEKFRLWSIS